MNKDRTPSYKPRWKRIWVAYGAFLLVGFGVLFALDRAGLLVRLWIHKRKDTVFGIAKISSFQF